MDLGTTEAVKKARDAARQARKIASEAKAKAQVGMPSVTSWLFRRVRYLDDEGRQQGPELSKEAME